MSIVVTVMNMKGGVGKTTVCAHLGGILARRKYGGVRKNILWIDYDPQFNLSQAFIRGPKYFELEENNKTCLQILQDPDVKLDPFQIQTPLTATPPKVAELVWSTTNIYHLHIIPSTLDLMYVALGTSTGSLPIIEARFKKFIAQCRAEYDLIMIDCHPAGSILTRTSLHNPDHVLVPVAPQAFAARGVGLMERFIDANDGGATEADTTHCVQFDTAKRPRVGCREPNSRAREVRSVVPAAHDQEVQGLFGTQRRPRLRVGFWQTV